MDGFKLLTMRGPSSSERHSNQDYHQPCAKLYCLFIKHISLANEKSIIIITIYYDLFRMLKRRTIETRVGDTLVDVNFALLSGESISTEALMRFGGVGR